MVTDAEILELRERNERRLVEVKEKLGSKWCLHPDNYAKRIKPKGNAK